VNTKVKEFALCFMFLEVAMVGAFVALDLFLFYVFGSSCCRRCI